MAFLEINLNQSVQVLEEKYLYSKWGFRQTDLIRLCMQYGFLINRDIFIITRYKNSNLFYPRPLIFFETTSFRRVIETEKLKLLRKYSQTYRSQHIPDRLGRLRYEFHTTDELVELLGKRINPMDKINNYNTWH